MCSRDFDDLEVLLSCTAAPSMIGECELLVVGLVGELWGLGECEILEGGGDF